MPDGENLYSIKYWRTVGIWRLLKWTCVLNLASQWLGDLDGGRNKVLRAKRLAAIAWVIAAAYSEFSRGIRVKELNFSKVHVNVLLQGGITIYLPSIIQIITVIDWLDRVHHDHWGWLKGRSGVSHFVRCVNETPSIIFYEPPTQIKRVIRIPAQSLNIYCHDTCWLKRGFLGYNSS